MRRKILKPADRLIVAADYKPTERGSGSAESVRTQVLTLADSLADIGACIKINSALRACGYGLIREIHQRGLPVFADLKLNDIPETLLIDGALLEDFAPEFLTVMSSSSSKSLVAIRGALSEVEILGVTVLTSMDEQDAHDVYNSSVTDAVEALSREVVFSGLDGFIASPAEAKMLHRLYKSTMSINTPGVRPKWSIVGGDDQNAARVKTPAQAIAEGADRIVIGRPITQSREPYDAAMRTLEELAL